MDDLERTYIRLKTTRSNIYKNILSNKAFIKKQRRKLLRLNNARELIKAAMEMSQENLKEIIESLVTMIIQSIYDRPFEYKLLLETNKRGLVAKPVIVEGERIYEDIERDLGGGIIDLISIGQRLVFWKLMGEDRPRPFFILDEPFKNLGVLTEKVIALLKILSKKLGITWLITTHDKRLMAGAHKVFSLVMKRGVTHTIRRRRKGG